MNTTLRSLVWCFFILLLGFTTAKAQEVTVKLLLAPRPSPYLSDWQSNPNAIIVILTNTTTQPIAGKLSIQLDRNGSKVADIKEAAKPSITLSPGITQIHGSDVLPLTGIQYYGESVNEATRSGMLPAGEYQICVRFDAVIGGGSTAPPRTITSSDCKNTQIQITTAPVLLSPADGQVLSNTLPTFSWTPAMPQTSQPMQYQLRIYPVYPNQNPSQAMAMNPSAFQQQVSGTSITVPLSSFFAVTASAATSAAVTDTRTVQTFVWKVEQILPDGKSLSSNPSVFTTEHQNTTVVSDTDCTRYKIEYEAAAKAAAEKCTDCDDLENQLKALQQQLALAQSNLASANEALEKAKNDENDAAKKAKASAKSLQHAMNNFSSMAKALGLTVTTYGPPGGFSSILQNGLASVGGGSGGSGVAVQGSNGSMVAAGGGFGRDAHGGSNFWAAFRNLNNQFAANQAIQNALSAAQAASAAAAQAVANLNQQIKDLEAQIADLKSKIDDCNKKKKELQDERDKLAEEHDRCLKKLNDQHKAEEKIKEAEDALHGAGTAIGDADNAIGAAGKEVDNRPGASGAGVDNAKDENNTARGDSTKADELLKKAKEAQATGDSETALKLAEEAKAAAEQARKEANQAGSDANDAQNDAKKHPTKAQIDEANRIAKEEADRRAKAAEDLAQRTRFICTRWLLGYLKEHHSQSWSEWFQGWSDFFNGINGQVSDGLSEPTDKFKEMMEELSQYADELRQLSQLFEGLNTNDPMARAKAFGTIMEIAAKIAEKVPGFKEFIGFYAEAYNAAIAGIQDIAKKIDKPHIKWIDTYLLGKGCGDENILKWGNMTLDQIVDSEWKNYLAHNVHPVNSAQEARLKEYFKQQLIAKILACCIEKMKVTASGG